MTLQNLDDLLKGVCPKTFRDGAPGKEHRCVIWHCYGADSLSGDNGNQVDAPKVQIDILTKTTTDDLVDDVCGALSAAGLSYQVLDYQTYDEDFNALRTILQLVVI